MFIYAYIVIYPALVKGNSCITPSLRIIIPACCVSASVWNFYFGYGAEICVRLFFVVPVVPVCRMLVLVTVTVTVTGYDYGLCY